jgi:hypothetical protein
MVRSVAAVSVGVVDGVPVLDLDYPEDVSAGTDMNVVATGDGELVEVQGTAEGAPFSRPSSTRCSTSRSRHRDAGPACSRPRWPSRCAQARRRRGEDVTPQVVLATQNRGKVEELRRILAPHGVELLGLADVDAVRAGPRDRRDFAATRSPRPARRCSTPGCPPSPTTAVWRSTR